MNYRIYEDQLNMGEANAVQWPWTITKQLTYDIHDSSNTNDLIGIFL